MYARSVIATAILLICASTCAHTQEVTCSKFDYELQTLKTVVKMEFEMSLMEKKMKKWANVMEERDEKNKAIEVKRDTKIEELTGTISKLKQDTQDLTERLEQANRVARDRFEQRLTDVSTNVSDQMAAIRAKREQVAFTVHTPTGALINNVPTFQAIVLNLGDGYNKATGKFTSPIAGLYQFAVTLLTINVRSGGNMQCDLRRNDSKVVNVYSQEGRHDSASVIVIVHMAVGDVFDLRCSNWRDVNKSRHTVYTGMLLNAD